MENERPPVTPPPEARRRITAEDNLTDASPQSQSRSTDRPAHTPRDVRTGDHPSRPGALPPAPGRLHRASALSRFGRSRLLPTALLAVLTTVSEQVAGRGPLLHLDVEIRDAIARTDRSLPHGLVRPAVDDAAHALADLGGALIAVPALLCLAALAAWRVRRAGAARWWLPLPTAALAAVLIPALVVPAKVYFARPGPTGAPLLPGESGWFPSGHTATATIAYGIAALLLVRTVTAARVRRALRTGATTLAAAVGAGLMWCDYHWFLDVLASWCLSGLVLWTLARWTPAPQ